MYLYFFFNDTATTEIYTLSLHDALPISPREPAVGRGAVDGQAEVREDAGRLRHELEVVVVVQVEGRAELGDRKSTRLNSSHANISYAVFCLKKKKGTANNCTRITKRYLI